MASGYIINGEWIPEQDTLPAILSTDSVCGAAMANANLPTGNDPAPVVSEVTEV